MEGVYFSIRCQLKPEETSMSLFRVKFVFSIISIDSHAQNPEDRSSTKRDLKYWIDLAKILERGNINALFLADTYGGYDTYEGCLDNCIRRAAQWPVTDPTIVSHLVRKVIHG